MLCLVRYLFVISPTTSVIDCLGRFVPEMTYHVSNGTLSLTKLKLQLLCVFILMMLWVYHQWCDHYRVIVSVLPGLFDECSPVPDGSPNTKSTDLRCESNCRLPSLTWMVLWQLSGYQNSFWYFGHSKIQAACGLWNSAGWDVNCNAELSHWGHFRMVNYLGACAFGEISLVKCPGGISGGIKSNEIKCGFI